MSDSSQENLFSRWSRRKSQSTNEIKAEDESIALQQQALPEQELSPGNIPAEQITQEPVLTDADMPAIESLEESSDFSVFMSSGVSDKLRNLALRKMFKAPVYNIRDGLDDYDELYTNFEKLGDIVTSDMKHLLAMKASKKMEEETGKALDSENHNDQESSQTIDLQQDRDPVSKQPQDSFELESSDSTNVPDTNSPHSSSTVENTEKINE